MSAPPHPHGREQLADFLWDDRPRKQALSNLRSLLAQLPEAIKPYVTADRQTIGITHALPVWVDAHALAATASTSHTPAALSAALHLYQGDFLEGGFVRESRGLEEWSALWRERLQRHTLQAHLHLAEHHLHHRQYHEARHLCHQIGDQRGLASTEFHLGTTAAALGHEQSAFAHLLHGLETAAIIQFMPMVLESLLRLAQREHQQWPPDLLAHVVAFVATHPAADKAWEPQLVALAAGLPPAAAPSALAALVTAVRLGSF